MSAEQKGVNSAWRRLAEIGFKTILGAVLTGAFTMAAWAATSYANIESRFSKNEAELQGTKAILRRVERGIERLEDKMDRHIQVHMNQK